jgi:polar amino acid transport system permease protein
MKSKTLYYILSIGIFVAFAYFIIMRQRRPFDLSLLDGYQTIVREGFINTIYASIIALIGSVVLGFILYILTTTKLRFFQAFVDVFTEIIYGTPLLVMIVVMAFLIGPAFNIYSRSVMGILGLIIYITPYMTNIFKSAFSSISEEQYMAMDLFGFTAFQRYRYIIIPQVIRILMPPLMNNFSLIIKGSALLSVLSHKELYYAIQIAQSRTFAFVEGYLLMWALYLVITIPLSQLTKLLERKWSLQ